MNRTSVWCALLAFAAALSPDRPVGAQQITAAPQVGICELSRQPDQSWTGICGPVFGNKEAASITARTVGSLPGGIGRSDAKPDLMFVGQLPTQYGPWDLEIEFYGRTGAVRTPGVWRPVTLMGDQEKATLQFRIVEDAQVEPTDIDFRIVQRASEILKTEAMWNRADDRTCAPDAKSWSLYCALQRASVEVSGGFHHRRPCLQVARAILYERVDEERKKGRKYPHIMEDYNNDSATRFGDIRSLFTDVAARMKQRK